MIEKERLTAICIDDFALKKRQRYGTIMVNIQTGCIVDMISSREADDVRRWLGEFPNIKFVCRDGSATYAAAITAAHPNAQQISDRFHLVKNLHERAKQYFQKLFQGRVKIPMTVKTQEHKMEMSIGTREDKIALVRKLYNQGKNKQEISNETGIATRTVKKYLESKEIQVLKSKQTVRGREHEEAVKKVQVRVDRVKKLKEQGLSLYAIQRETGHTYETIKKYLGENFTAVNAHYGNRREGKLVPYQKDVLQMRAKGMTYAKIHIKIKAEGYTGTEDAIRGFISKERRIQNDLKKGEQNDTTELIERRWLIRLLYKPIEKVKGMTKEQYNAVINAYPKAEVIYKIVHKFKEILKAGDPKKLIEWMNEVEALKIEEMNAFINGLRGDLAAVKNAIAHNYSNGLAEGSVNKLKVIKRIMYGRCSFELIRKNTLQLEHLKQFN